MLIGQLLLSVAHAPRRKAESSECWAGAGGLHLLPVLVVVGWLDLVEGLNGEERVEAVTLYAHTFLPAVS